MNERERQSVRELEGVCERVREKEIHRNLFDHLSGKGIKIRMIVLFSFSQTSVAFSRTAPATAEKN